MCVRCAYVCVVRACVIECMGLLVGGSTCVHVRICRCGCEGGRGACHVRLFDVRVVVGESLLWQAPVLVSRQRAFCRVSNLSGS